jgi:hypothetical protein
MSSLHMRTPDVQGIFQGTTLIRRANFSPGRQVGSHMHDVTERP